MIFGFALATCFIPGWTGAAIPTGWKLLSCALPLMLWGKVRWRNEYLLGLSFLAYALLSLMWTPVAAEGIGGLWLLSLLALAFLLGEVSASPARIYLGLATGVAISTALAIPQLYWDWTGIYQFWKPAGLFINPGVYGETCALVLVALLATKQYWPTILVAPGIYLSGSRTAVLAVVAAAIVFTWDKVSSLGANRSALWKNPYVLSAAVVLTLGTALVARSTMEREPNWWTSPAERLAIWQDTFSGLTWTGQGAGSFLITYPIYAKRTDTMATRPEHAHSDILELAYEYGLGALPLALLVVLALCGPLAPERYLLVTFLTIALFAFPLRLPVEGFLGAFALGRLSRGWFLLWNTRRYCGLSQPAWEGDRVYG